MFRVLYVSDLTWKFLSVGQAILALFLIYATIHALATLFFRVEDDDGWLSGGQVISVEPERADFEPSGVSPADRIPEPSGDDSIPPVPCLDELQDGLLEQIPHFRRIDHPETDSVDIVPVVESPVPVSEEFSRVSEASVQWKGVEGLVAGIDSLGEKLSELNVNTLRNVMSSLLIVGDRKKKKELLARAVMEVEGLAEMVSRGPLPPGFSRRAISSLAEVARAVEVRNFKAALDILEGLHDSIMNLFYPGG